LQLAVKRLVDILVSTLLIVLFAPIMIAALIFVKFDSRGPAIFTQERIGLNKRRFRMYKFRSMVADAEKRLAELEARNEAQGPVFKIKDDPRITRIGKLLRKTSVDELPQLFNVLKGDMSLVGPRPLSVRDFMGLNEDWQRRRFSVRPGVTCLWQVSGRSSVSFDQWMHLDIQYVDRWTLWLDIKILARTIPAVVKGLGAV
jgi:exopolysaccharide biosynthesis polyprenyl glycosylphosphotransferase